jgi:signal transduction histidine kinase
MNPAAIPSLDRLTPTLLFGFIFALSSLIFLLLYRRTGERHLLWVAGGTLSAALAWGTTEWQNVGRPIVDWGWWWAQPLFAGCTSLLGVGLMGYLPLSPTARRRLNHWLLGIPATYLTVVTALLLLDVQMIRLWVVVCILPAVLIAAIASIYAGRLEPGSGHVVLGLCLLSVPVITVGVVASGSTTNVVRFWTGLPFVAIILIMVNTSVLRDHRRLQGELQRRREAERRIAQVNASLASRIQIRRRELNDTVTALDAFNRHVSHDLRSPLGSIDTLAFVADQMLAKGAAAPDITDTLAQIRSLVRSSHQTIGALLTLAKVTEEGVVPRHVDLKAIADDAVKEAMLARGLASTGAAVPTVNVAPLGHAWVDPTLLRLVLVNLVGNAIKFNLGRADCVVTVGRDDQLPRLLGDAGARPVEPTAIQSPCLFVKDTGVGFDPGQGQAAFEPFRRMGSARMAGGHGLGLNIVRRIVDRLEGSVWLQSSPGHGTLVAFTFGNGGQPATPPHPSEPAFGPQPAPEQAR